MKKFNYFLIDLDGTLILGKRVLDGAIELLQELKSHGKKFLILTNNSSKSSFAYLRFLRQLGLPVGSENIFTSGKATAMYLKEMGIKEAYIIGTKSTIREFETYGIKFNLKSRNLVLAFDTTLNFKKLEKATEILKNKKGVYIATHPDNICPIENGFIPDVGSFIALLKEATGQIPDFIPGKPSRYFFTKAMDLMNAFPEETAIIGDRLTTDIKTGKDFGITSMLVLTGETKREDLERSEIKPDFIFENLTDLLKFLGRYL
ncbi:MAG: HAD-IIA family hydrolase [bacterium]|nr:HAD-IIA family hydrolase [bacterium]